MGTLISKGLLLLGTILIVKYVDKTIYGEFGIIKSTVNMFTVFAGLGLGLTATKYIAQLKETNKERVARIIGLSNFFSISISLLIVLFFLFFSGVLANQINAPHLKGELQLSGFILFFAALNGLQNGILAGFEKFKLISINNIIASVASVITQVLGAKYFGLQGIILGFGLNFVILYILNRANINKIESNGYQYKLFDKRNFKEISIIWNFSIPAVLSGLMVSPVIWLTNSFLVLQQNGYQQMANFDIANQWRTTVLFIPAALAQIALPMLSSAKDEDYNNILNKNIFLNFLIALIIVLPMILLAPFILSFYGNQYDDAYYPLIIMLITTVLVAVNNIIGQAIASKGKMWIGFSVNAIWGILLILISYILMFQFNYGVVGLCFAYLISYAIHTMIQYFVYIKISVRL